MQELLAWPFRKSYLTDVPFQDVERCKLGDPRTFHYLNQTNCHEVANVDDAREYLETRNAMDIVGISQDEQVCTLPIHTDGLMDYLYLAI
jgi:hypothetical protein